jgi:hypothetical protein
MTRALHCLHSFSLRALSGCALRRRAPTAAGTGTMRPAISQLAGLARRSGPSGDGRHASGRTRGGARRSRRSARKTSSVYGSSGRAPSKGGELGSPGPPRGGRVASGAAGSAVGSRPARPRESSGVYGESPSPPMAEGRLVMTLALIFLNRAPRALQLRQPSLQLLRRASPPSFRALVWTACVHSLYLL